MLRHKALRGALFFSAVAASALTLPIPAAHATGIGIQPANVELVVQPGSSIRRSIRVANLRTDKPQKFIVGVADWTLDDNGQLKLLPPSAASAGGWVRYAPASFTLKPAEAQDIVVDIAIPAKLPEAREYHMAILVTNPMPSAEEMKKLNGVWNQVQVASLFYLTPPSTKPAPVAEQGILDPAGAGFVRARISNSGQAHARLIAKFQITNASGKEVHSGDAQTVLLPGQTREWRGSLNAAKLEPGKYSVNWKLYTVFDPDRPNERIGELLQEQTWPWNKTSAAEAPPAPAKSATKSSK